jgi:hypothetical protein
MQRMTRIGLALWMLLAIAGASHAQTLGTIAGVVKDASGAVLGRQRRSEQPRAD